MQTDRGVVRRGGKSERSPMLDQRMKQNEREKRRVKEIAEGYKNLAICQGWKGQRRPQKLDILTKTIEYVKKLQEHKGSQGIVKDERTDNVPERVSFWQMPVGYVFHGVSGIVFGIAVMFVVFALLVYQSI